jgi:hypothetical protein
MEMDPKLQTILTQTGEEVKEYGRKIANPESSMEDVVNMRDCLIMAASVLTTILQSNTWYNRRW